MDYSTLPTDPENPGGSSPWASSSPRHSRSSFGPSAAGEASPSPLPSQPSPYSDFPSSAQGYVGSDDSPLGAGRADDSPPASRGRENGDGGRADSPEAGQDSQPYSPRHHYHHQNEVDSPSQQQQQQRREGGRQEPQRYHSTRPKQTAPQAKLQAKVTGLERTGRKDPILRFDAYTNLPKFRTTQFRDVRRTHSEFVKLAEHLISSNPEALVPAVPPPLTSAGAGTDEDEARVKASMQRWLNNVCGNEVLMRDEEMVFFVESDFGYSPVIRRKQPATGVRRKMLKQFAPPPDDTPELQQARPVVKLFYLGTMETGQKVDKVVKARRSLGTAEADLGVKLSQMNVQETHPGLANAYRKLGKVIQTTGDFHAAQGTAEATTLGDALQYHSSDAFVVKETLTNRHILLRELIQAQQSTRAKLSAADRLKASSSVRRDKVDEAIAALDEARSHEAYLTQKTQRVTANLLLERRKWFARTAADLRSSIREYVVRQIEAERRTLANLEAVRPDIRAVDASGGLSRLGREHHPAAVRRASLASSQGPRGDAWSGIPRRADGLNRSITSSLTSGVPEEDEEEDEGGEGGGRGGGEEGEGGVKSARKRAGSTKGAAAEDDEDRMDARNAASRLAQTTF